MASVIWGDNGNVKPLAMGGSAGDEIPDDKLETGPVASSSIHQTMAIQ